MISRLTSIATLALFLAFSCTPKQKQVTEQEFDKTVMQEIFPSLIDSMYVEIVFAAAPPPITEVVDSVTGKKELKPAGRTPLDKQFVRDQLTRLKQDSIETTIIFDDSIHRLYKIDRENFRAVYPVQDKAGDTSYLEKSYAMPLKDLRASPCFTLKLRSEYRPVSSDSLHLVRIIGRISFSRIIFDANKTHGMLTCSEICGPLCGNGYRVYIQKVNEKWVIHRIEHVWVA